MSFDKYGVVKPGESISDFDPRKKIKYADAEGMEMADEENKDQLKNPILIEDIEDGVEHISSK